MKAPFDKYRPTRIADGAGGFTESNGTATTLWGEYSYYKNIHTLGCVGSKEDVDIDDVVKIENAFYRVMGVLQIPGAITKALTLERMDAPVELD